MAKSFLFVTANKNETAALLKDKDFFKYDEGVRSDNENDDNFYNVGYFGKYKVTHFELVDQGSVKSGASLLSICKAIEFCQPDGVILLGIAFGKENEETENREQYIGDILLSKQIADYESGKIKDGTMKLDGAMPEAGKTLISVFNYFSSTWNHSIEGRKVKCHLGTILSGDKVVDDPEFKKQLFKYYPRAIGGEMEGRGAYAACRDRRLDEWIIIKAICDWGENKSNPNKQRDQELASESVVSLLKHVFSVENAFEKLPERTKKKQDIGKQNITPLGYFISIGMTSCRLFQVHDKEKLTEKALYSYEVNDFQDEEYLDGIIDVIKKKILPQIEEKPAKLFTKVFVDYNFIEVFEKKEDTSAKDDFLLRFYQETGLCFNILTKNQTFENLKRMVGSLEAKSAIVSIGSRCLDVLEYTGQDFHMHNVPITLDDVSDFVRVEKLPSIWSRDDVNRIKKFIKKKIGDSLKDVFIENAIIIKNELSFMQQTGYQLTRRGDHYSLTFKTYKNDNHSLLFECDYKEKLREKYGDDAQIHRLYAFRFGHIILEAVFELIACKNIIPKNDHSIYGSGVGAYITYIFNIAISGSTHEGRSEHILDARRRLENLGANILSPRIDMNGQLNEITPDTEYAHLKAIRECDLLFVCNNEANGYIGESTKCEIYYAFALNKPIAFWRNPSADERISFIPSEPWEPIMNM